MNGQTIFIYDNNNPNKDKEIAQVFAQSVPRVGEIVTIFADKNCYKSWKVTKVMHGAKPGGALATFLYCDLIVDGSKKM